MPFLSVPRGTTEEVGGQESSSPGVPLKPLFPLQGNCKGKNKGDRTGQDRTIARTYGLPYSYGVKGVRGRYNLGFAAKGCAAWRVLARQRSRPYRTTYYAPGVGGGVRQPRSQGTTSMSFPYGVPFLSGDRQKGLPPYMDAAARNCSEGMSGGFKVHPPQSQGSPPLAMGAVRPCAWCPAEPYPYRYPKGTKGLSYVGG